MVYNTGVTVLYRYLKNAKVPVEEFFKCLKHFMWYILECIDHEIYTLE